MRLISYTLLRIRRRSIGFLVAAAIFCALVLVLFYAEDSLAVRQAGLDRLVDQTVIDCTLMDEMSARIDALNADYRLALYVLPEDGHPLSKRVHDVRASSVLYVKTALTQENVTLCFATSVGAVGPKTIAYQDGYGDSLFAGDEPVCLIGENAQTWLNEEGMMTFVVPPDQYVDTVDGRAPVQSPISLRAVGVIKGGGAVVYAPWQTYLSLAYENDLMPHLDSLAFLVRDNRALEETKEALSEAFFLGGQRGESADQTLLVIHDQLYKENLNTARRNLTLMNLARPLLIVCALGVGMLLSMLLIRARRQEYAILRGIGQKRAFITAQSAAETLFACLLGGALAALIAQSFDIAGFSLMLLFFLLGSVCPTIGYMMKPVLKQINWEE